MNLPGELRSALEALARRPHVLLAFDFDGCLAPLVLVPEEARALPASHRALHALAALPGTTVALVSGRDLAGLRRVSDPPPQAFLVGSHGGEFAGPDGADERGGGDGELLARLEAAVAAIVAAHPGTSLERKPAAAVLHTRRADRPVAAAATAAVLAGPARWAGVHALPGKEVVELAVSDVTKGDAIRRLRGPAGTPSGGGGVLYAGDDVTDEHAFAALDDAAGDVTVKVGEGRSRARHRVADPAAVAELLQQLLRLRQGALRQEAR